VPWTRAGIRHGRCRHGPEGGVPTGARAAPWPHGGARPRAELDGARQPGLHTRRRSSRERDGRGAGLGGGASSAGATACALAGARRWPPRRAPVRRGPPAATALAPRGSGRDGAPGPRPGALEADGARSPAASAPPPLSLALSPAEAARRRTPWRVPRQGRWRGAAASAKAERSGGEGEGGAQRRAGGGARDERRQRRERGRVGAVGARREDGWERERKGWREEGEMHER